MKKIKLKLLSILILITLIFIPYSVHAASFSASAATSLEPNKTTKLSVTTTECAGKFSVSSSNPSVVSVSAASTFVDGTTMSPEITLTSKGEGTATITITAVDVLDQSYNDVTGSRTVKITVKAPSTSGGNTGGSTGSTTGGTTGGTTSGGSTTTKPTAPTFKDVSKTVYANGDINLRASWSTSSSATQVAKGTELRLTGTSTEKVNGYVWYRVTYNGQIKYVAKDLITETKPEEKSNNVNLKILAIEDVVLTPEFSNDITEYSAKLVDFEGTELNVIAEAEDEKATVKIEGNTNIVDGENVITITVTAEDGTTKVYTITVVKEEAEAFGLSSLIIKDVELKGFTIGKYEYKVSFEALEKLEIEAIASEEGATIEILGNENLVEGENLITIIVTSADGTKTATYQIKATKLAVTGQEETKQINMKAILISALIALVVLVVIIILIVKYVKRNAVPVVDYEYHDNLENNKQDENNTEFASEITPQSDIIEERDKKSSRVDELFAEDIDETPRRRGKGKHSK